MWTCIKCFASIPCNQVEASIDDFGIYFLCPHCKRRNRLVNVGKHGRIALMQQERSAP
ncbi:hypothetical protein LMG28138_03918 [Pararobbsia alpina]|uniref:Uncharacterized protein n=1 Tax=Pararobbsia alpina TaxID=621374 RepID=A0A6S7BCT0_9BURK|nr:hypothetical protein LMG28138_03918 [Pararobbsia alpina]